MEKILSLIWSILNTGPGTVFIAGIIISVLTWVYRKKPGWEAFEGTLITVIKWAEKAVPDETENAGLKRLDLAFEKAIKIYEEVTKKRASAKIKQELKEGIQITHAALETSGALKKIETIGCL